MAIASENRIEVGIHLDDAANYKSTIQKDLDGISKGLHITPKVDLGEITKLKNELSALRNNNTIDLKLGTTDILSQVENIGTSIRNAFKDAFNLEVGKTSIKEIAEAIEQSKDATKKLKEIGTEIRNTLTAISSDAEIDIGELPKNLARDLNKLNQQLEAWSGDDFAGGVNKAFKNVEKTLKEISRITGKHSVTLPVKINTDKVVNDFDKTQRGLLRKIKKNLKEKEIKFGFELPLIIDEKSYEGLRKSVQVALSRPEFDVAAKIDEEKLTKSINGLNTSKSTLPKLDLEVNPESIRKSLGAALKINAEEFELQANKIIASIEKIGKATSSVTSLSSKVKLPKDNSADTSKSVSKAKSGMDATLSSIFLGLQGIYQKIDKINPSVTAAFDESHLKLFSAYLTTIVQQLADVLTYTGRIDLTGDMSVALNNINTSLSTAFDESRLNGFSSKLENIAKQLSEVAKNSKSLGGNSQGGGISNSGNGSSSNNSGQGNSGKTVKEEIAEIDNLIDKYQTLLDLRNEARVDFGKSSSEYATQNAEVRDIEKKISEQLKSKSIDEQSIKLLKDRFRQSKITSEQELKAMEFKANKQKELNNLEQKIAKDEGKYYNYMDMQPADVRRTDDYNKMSSEYAKLQDIQSEVRAAINDGNYADFEKWNKELFETEKQLDSIRLRLKNNYNQQEAVSKNADKLNKIYKDTTETLDRVGKRLKAIDPETYKKLQILSRRLAMGNIDFSSARKELAELQMAIRRAGLEADSFWKKLGRTVGSRLRSDIAGSGWFMVAASMKDVYRNVVELDTAMTELKKVTEGTEATYARFLDDASNRAQKLGATLTNVVSATADFARLGYDIPDASALSDAATIYLNVGDDVNDIEQASSTIVSTMQGFGIEAENVMSIIDKFNAVSNNYASSAGNIGEIVKRSAAAMKVAGSDISEVISLGVTANTVIQDADVVGTALKTMSMRLRSSKSDLEAAGEDTDGMADSVSKLRDEILALTGVDIMLNEDRQKYVLVKLAQNRGTPEVDNPVGKARFYRTKHRNGGDCVEDLTGMKFGLWTVNYKVGKDPSKKGRDIYWNCTCECGTIKNVLGKNLRNGQSRSCGCLNKKDLSGMRFGNLIVEETIYGIDNRAVHKCICDCGNMIFVKNSSIRKTKSCGCSRFADLTGRKFGRLTVQKMIHSYKNSESYCVCDCDCGNLGYITRANGLVTENTKSCGCIHSPSLVGEKFGRLTVIKRNDDRNSTKTWECLCDCGMTTFVSGYKLKSGHTQSCGCIFSESTSTFETMIKNFLIENDVKFQFQKTFDGCISKKNRKLRFDFYIDAINTCVEDQGMQHFKPIDYFGGIENFIVQQENDMIKREYCKKNNIGLLEIPYTLSRSQVIDEIKILINKIENPATITVA